MNSRHIMRFALLVASLLLIAGQTAPLAAKETLSVSSCMAQGWPQDTSDLKPNPALTFGTLKNGLRYVILRHQEPKGRVSLQLQVRSGSLHETDEQRGLAHYLEHMMFNGTTQYPPGKMVEYFQSIGMAFGPDNNAHTTYDETVYQLMLPDSNEMTINKGLQLLTDYAGGALLLPKEVDKERGVILAEKRERNSAARRVFRTGMEQCYAGTLIAKRDVVGTDEVLKTADAALLRNYYERWYRPDNMLLVAVGDAEPSLLEKVINEQFTQLKARTAQPICPDLGKVTDSGLEASYQPEPDLGFTYVSVSSTWNTEPKVFTQAVALRFMQELVASYMFNNRLQRLVSSKDSLLTSADFYNDIMAQRFGSSVLKAKADGDKWKDVLGLLNQTLRQALTAGFTEDELERVKQEVMSFLKEQVESAASKKSDDLASEIITALNKDEVPLSPAQELELYGPALDRFSLKEVNEAFRSLWHERRLIRVAGTADLKGAQESPEELIRATWKAAEAAELKPWQPEEKAVFPYLPPPAAQATVVQRIVHDKIGVERHVFSNGLVLNLKKTDFEPNELQVAVMFGSGQLAQPKPGIYLLAQLLVEESGVGKLDKEQLKAALAQYSSSVDFQIDEEYFQLKGKGLTSETELLFQLLHTQLHDPAFRPDAFDRVLRKTEQLYAQMQSSVEGMMQLKGEPFLAGGNLRYGLVPLEMLKSLTVADVEGWLAPVFKNEPLEISVVGDFNKEQILKLVGQYFGDERKASPQATGEKITFPSGKHLTESVATATDKALVLVAWPTDDFWDIARTRRLNVLSAVLDDRLRKQIREELGAAYSPYVYNQSSMVDPGYGVLRSVMTVEPGQATALAGKLRQVGADLAADKVTAEELTRALEPSLTSIRDMVRTNRYWLESVLISSSRHPQRLEWPLTIQSDFAAIKAEELNALAAKYLESDKAAEVILLPEKK